VQFRRPLLNNKQSSSLASNTVEEAGRRYMKEVLLEVMELRLSRESFGNSEGLQQRRTSKEMRLTIDLAHLVLKAIILLSSSYAQRIMGGIKKSILG
jgi:hypothetical protein